MQFLNSIRAWIDRTFFWLAPKNKSVIEQTPESERDHALVLSVTKPKAIPKWRQLRYASRILSQKERQAIALTGILGIILLLSAVILLLAKYISAVPVVGGTYTEALIGEPHALNPVDAPANQTDLDLCSLIYSGLFKQKGMELLPDLAESYSWSEDFKTLTVKIRQDANFHNGAPVTADDVQYTIEAIQDPVRKSLLSPLFKGVKAAVIDGKTIQFNLDQSDITFLNSLTVGVLPASLWINIPPQNARLANLSLKPIGSGPYKVKSFTKDNHGIIRSYALERSDDYYGIKPHIKTINFQFYPDLQPAEEALKSDLVDGLAFLMPADTQRFNSAARWHTIDLKTPQQTIAFFNVKDKTLEDLRVRQALIMAVNRQDVVAALFNRAEIADTPFPFVQSASGTITDLEGARDLLQKSGWVLPSNDNVRIFQKAEDRKDGQIPESNASSTKLTLTILVPEQTDLVNMAEVLKRQWSLLGAQIEIQSMDAAGVLKKSTRDRDAQIILWNVLLGPDQNLFPIWWSGQANDRGTNFSGISETKIDDLINQSKSATSTDGLTAVRNELSSAIMEKAPAAFLVRPHFSYIISTRIKGMPESIEIAKPSDRFNDIQTWYIKTGWRLR
ncbi:MAG: ABC transporter substrate-binding protein [Patescibacteria group bacterium]